MEGRPTDHRWLGGSSPGRFPELCARRMGTGRRAGSHLAGRPYLVGGTKDAFMKPPPCSERISLVIADVDGTLVTHEKVLTERTKDAVQRLREQGIRFAITSGRPPRGMKM